MRTVVLLLALALAAQAASLRPEQLRCEYRTNPLGIDVTQPRLSWVLAAVDPKARGLKQTAYRVLATTAAGTIVWDSGRVASDQSVHVPYQGRPLTSGMFVSWKVQVWDQDGKLSAWSAPALFSIGLLKPEDWTGKWIGRDETGVYKNPDSPFWNLAKARWIWGPNKQAADFRTAVNVPAGRQVSRAVCVMAADSAFELSLNGQPAGKGSNVRMPDVLDVTSYIHPGENAIAVHATHRQSNRPAGLIGALRIDFVSGEPLLVYTGRQWQAEELGAYGMAPWGEVGFSEEHALPARMLRKEFTTPRKVRRATAYVSGLGLFELYLNGRKIGDEVLSPGLTDYEKRVLYVTYDVTSRIAEGRNAIGLMLGNGRYFAPRGGVPIGTRGFGFPKARLQLDLEYDGGVTGRVVTDETWKLTAAGPIRANNEFDGEEYDARLEMANWSRPGFDDSKWEAAREVAAPPGVLAAQMAEPLRITETLRPVKVTQLRPGVTIYDMGQNMVGWCRLRMSGPQGARVTLRHAETLREDGSLYVDNLRSARATDIYILKGGAPETWEPRFTYHGFRYVEVRGPVTSLEGRVVHDDMRRIADFTSSNELLNRIHHNIFWGVRGNYRSIPTDCPQRDERQGWLGDRSMVSRSESYLFDVAAFYNKWETDLADSQRPNGAIPDVAPAYWVLYNDDVTWPSTFLFVPSMVYEQYGDRRVVERNYPGMKKWIDHMSGYLKDDLMPRDRYGDWCVPPESPKLIHSQDPGRRTDGTLIGTAYYYHLLRLMSRYARLLDRPQDASAYDSLAARIDAAFQQKFFNPQSGIYSNGTQTSGILPLAFGMAPKENRASVFGALIAKIEGESQGHVGTGLIGAQWLMRTLSDNGRADVAYQIATQSTYPGWGYMIEKGATTVWELWNGDTADPAMNSGNHVMQIGDLGTWMYEYLAGIRSDPEKPGFRHIIIHPYPVEGLTFVKASHQSMYGRIATEWHRDGKQLKLEVTIPPNTTATVHLGGQTYEVGSGTYTFTAQL